MSNALTRVLYIRILTFAWPLVHSKNEFTITKIQVQIHLSLLKIQQSQKTLLINKSKFFFYENRRKEVCFLVSISQELLTVQWLAPLICEQHPEQKTQPIFYSSVTDGWVEWRER